MKFLIALTALLILSSCDDSSSSKSSPAAPTPPAAQQQNQPPVQQPPGQTPPGQTQPGQNPPVFPIPTDGLPTVSFVYNEFVYDGANKIYLELQLSQASNVPVVVDVELVNGTALYQRDYTGFQGCTNELRQTVVFAPQQTHVDLPFIWIRNDAACNSEFTAQLVQNSVQQAIISNNSTRIVLPCN